MKKLRPTFKSRLNEVNEHDGKTFEVKGVIPKDDKNPETLYRIVVYTGEYFDALEEEIYESVEPKTEQHDA